MSTEETQQQSKEQKESDVDLVYSKIEAHKNVGNSFFKKKEYHDAISRYDIAIEEYKTFIQTDYDKNSTETLKKLKAMLGSIFNNRAFAYFKMEMFGQVVLDCNQAIKFKFWKVRLHIFCEFAISNILQRHTIDAVVPMSHSASYPKRKRISRKR